MVRGRFVFRFGQLSDESLNERQVTLEEGVNCSWVGPQEDNDRGVGQQVASCLQRDAESSRATCGVSAAHEQEREHAGDGRDYGVCGDKLKGQMSFFVPEGYPQGCAIASLRQNSEMAAK